MSSFSNIQKLKVTIIGNKKLSSSPQKNLETADILVPHSKDWIAHGMRCLGKVSLNQQEIQHSLMDQMAFIGGIQLVQKLLFQATIAFQVQQVGQLQLMALLWLKFIFGFEYLLLFMWNKHVIPSLNSKCTSVTCSLWQQVKKRVLIKSCFNHAVPNTIV